MKLSVGLALGWMHAAAVLSTSCRGDDETQPPSPSLEVVDNAARSCEALLETTGSEASPKVGFPSSMRGAVQRKGSKFGIAFISTGDASFSAQVPLDWEPPSKRPPKVGLVNATCYDRLGRMLPGQGVVLHWP